jgi:hypothetical protein
MKKYPDQDRHEIEPGQIRITEVFAWILKHRDTYPVPEGVDPCMLFYYDLPENVVWQQSHFINISKKQYAEREAVAQSQVSRWINAGMPVREDGRIDVWDADSWLERYRKANAKRQMFGWKL